MSYTDFQSRRTVKALRKPRRCYQCNKIINCGETAEYFFGKYECDIYSMHVHPECHGAAEEFAAINGLWGEEFPFFPEMDDSEYEYHDWLIEKHPIVAARLGLDKHDTGELV